MQNNEASSHNRRQRDRQPADTQLNYIGLQPPHIQVCNTYLYITRLYRPSIAYLLTEHWWTTTRYIADSL